MQSDNTTLRQELSDTRKEVAELKSATSLPSQSPSNPHVHKDAVTFDCDYTDPGVLKGYILWTNCMDDIMQAESERLIAVHCDLTAKADILNQTKHTPGPYDKSDPAVIDKCNEIKEAFTSAFDICAPLHKDIKDCKLKGVQNASDLQRQADSKLLNILKGTVTNVNILSQINDCRAMQQPGYQAFYRVANRTDSQDAASAARGILLLMDLKQDTASVVEHTRLFEQFYSTATRGYMKPLLLNPSRVEVVR